ncbi:MAG: protein translocase subunit SecF [Chloroflexi bacterium]|nr:protein translocase subunit SecF [Chloroflexota bacterium]
MLDIVKYRYVYFLLSAAILLPGVVSMLLPGGLRPGIDFTSGSIMTLRFEQHVDQGELRQALAELNHSEAIVQRSGGEETFLVRTKPLEQPRADEQGEVSASERTTIVDALKGRFGPLEVLAFDHVSPLIASEIVWKSVVAVAAACVFILLYLWFAFRRIPRAWRYGSAAVIALVHDALVVLGSFSVLGRVTALELDAMFITAVLTVIGFSVHDTIVVFDRIRENFTRHAGEPLEDIVNHSLTQTLARSLNTSLTVLLVLFALMLFGGVTIRPFVLALLIGITTGTYSSIFFASMLLVVWERGELGRLFQRRRLATA